MTDYRSGLLKQILPGQKVLPQKRSDRQRKFVSIYNLLKSNFGETNGAW